MRTLALSLLATLAIALVGCSRNPLVGTWEGSDPAMPVGATATFTFEGDGTYSTSISAQGTTITMKGTYTLEDKKLTLQPESVDATGGAFAEMAKEQFEKGGKQPLEGTVEFVGSDEIKLSAGMGSSTLKRKK